MVTVVIITRNRARQLERALESLGRLRPKPPVIVVDNGSADRTPEVIARAGARAILLRENAGAAGRNLGVLEARTPYVAFSDDDSWWAPGALETAAALFEADERLGLVAARILVGLEERIDDICLAMRAMPRIHGFMACGAVVRREAFLQTGGFHPRYGVGGEERLVAIDLARRGWKLAYCEEVVAHHWPEAGERGGRRARMVRNDLWTSWLRAQGRDALGYTWQTARKALDDEEVRRGLAQACGGLPWVLRERSA